MISCLTDFIGLRGACEEVAIGGLWINDMPDAGIPKMEALSDVHSQDFVGLWNKVYGRACDQFASDIRKIIQPRIKTNDVIRNIRTSAFDLTKPLTSEPYWSGELITVYGSDFMELVISKLVIVQQLVNTPTFFSVYGYDADTGEQIFQKDLELTSATTEIEINAVIPINYGKRRIWVGFDRSGVLTFETTSKGDGCSCSTVCSNSKPMSMYLLDTPYNNVQFAYANLIADPYAKGISVTYGVRCSLNQFICQYKDVLAVALRWKAYIELLVEQMWNDSLTNKYTLLPAEELQNRITAAQGAYNDELTGVLKSITWEADPLCWECNEPASITYMIP